MKAFLSIISTTFLFIQCSNYDKMSLSFLGSDKWCSNILCITFYPTKIRVESSEKSDVRIREVNVEYSNTFNDKVYDSAIFIHPLNGEKSASFELVSKDTIFSNGKAYIRQK